MSTGRPRIDELRAALEREGLLLLADRELPSLTTLVAGEPVRGSWWSHRAGAAIYAAASALHESGAASALKLVDGKVTYVPRALYPALAAVACSGEEWQRARLSDAALELERRVPEQGELRVDELEARPDRDWRAAATELELRLLVQAEEVHTESGRHARVLRTFESWCAAARVPSRRPSAAKARARFEAIVERWASAGLRRARLPWEVAPPKRARR